MSGPIVEPDDIVNGAVTWLLQHSDAVDAVDAFNIGGALKPGIFPYRLWTRMEGSEKTSVVIAHDGGWAAPNAHNTLRFPRLTVSVWTDPYRDEQKNDIDPGVQARANAVFDVFDKLLHWPAGRDQIWGTIRVISCLRMTEPAIGLVPDGDGLVRIQTIYGVVQG